MNEKFEMYVPLLGSWLVPDGKGGTKISNYPPSYILRLMEKWDESEPFVDEMTLDVLKTVHSEFEKS